MTSHKRRVLRRALAARVPARLVGVGDAMSALIAARHGFDALWSSGLAISTSHGVPDAGLVPVAQLLATNVAIDRASPLPVLADCDSGYGDVNAFTRMVRAFDAAGIAGICIEDKAGPKRNSFLDGQRLAHAEHFAAKIAAAKRAQADPEFVVVARLESFIAGQSLEDALERAERYRHAGADALFVHSKASTPAEVTSFARAWRARDELLPLIVAPTTYWTVTCDDLAGAGIAGVIYANQALRAAVRAIDSAFATIQATGTSAPLEASIASVQEIFDLTEPAPVSAAPQNGAVDLLHGRATGEHHGELELPPEYLDDAAHAIGASEREAVQVRAADANGVRT